MQAPLAEFSKEERTFMDRRNRRILEKSHQAREMTKNQMNVLPDNRKVRKQLLGDWSTHIHRRG